MEKKFLINHGFSDFMAPELVFYTFSNDLGRVEALLKKGTSIDQRDDHGHTSLWWASHQQSLPMLRLLVNYGALKDLPYEEYLLFISDSASKNNEEIYHFWSVQNSIYFERAKSDVLRAAVAGYSLKLVKALLDLGADPNAGALSDGQTCLHVAAESLYVPIVEMLLKAGADVEVRTKFGHTAKDHALRYHLLSSSSWTSEMKVARDQIVLMLQKI
ncbi:MAG: ankyrin repeat domain-containing protein [Bdellovibrionaceae bacterium]|nr:ankyrin repeat domain-containing protein [Pseudobdellovibrionaceae bacterium]